ncbi:SAM-dependent methyltransferase [Accumulibacter sp.]|uniref:SAM-dependent methyltransferase n=1 Tax=Accumulibacter sp. TaxID=2053492 RepID=UPI0028C390F7|nr:SAM-dependent methyltransferase [Accumulibacter sp.]
MNKGKLYLIPVPLGKTAVIAVLPQAVIACAQGLGHFVAENAKSARAFLKSLPCTLPLQQIAIQELNEHTPAGALPALLAPLMAGTDVGLISEAGCPAVADPGATLVALAHQEGLQVVPMTGPSSILLALMGSGLSGQSFAFHGYLPSAPGEREKRLRELEKESRQGQRAQIFIETPYRNQQMLESLIKTCAPATRICVATDLTLDSEQITTRQVSAWQRQPLPEINRRPTVFLLQA